MLQGSHTTLLMVCTSQGAPPRKWTHQPKPIRHSLLWSCSFQGGRYEKFDVLGGPTSDLGQSTEGALGNGCVMSDTALCCSFLKTQHSGMQLEPQ